VIRRCSPPAISAKNQPFAREEGFPLCGGLPGNQPTDGSESRTVGKLVRTRRAGGEGPVRGVRIRPKRALEVFDFDIIGRDATAGRREEERRQRQRQADAADEDRRSKQAKDAKAGRG
jgi:hypothetical protein